MDKVISPTLFLLLRGREWRFCESTIALRRCSQGFFGDNLHDWEQKYAIGIIRKSDFPVIKTIKQSNYEPKIKIIKKTFGHIRLF